MGEIIFMDGKKLASINCCTLDWDEPSFFTKPVFLNQPLSFECNIEAPKLSHFLQELALQEAQMPQKFTFSQTVKVPKRRHHKTRISKKWAKLYGYDLYEDIYEILDMQNVDELNFETTMTARSVERKKIDG